MPLNEQQLLEEFVNRESEMDRFIRFLDDSSESVMMIWGGGGVGKSSLQTKMRHTVAQRNIKMTDMVWGESRNHDYLAIMRKIRDYLSVNDFNQFTDLVNHFTVANHKLEINVKGLENISMLDGSSITDSEIGNISAINITDLNLYEPRPDMDVPEDERRTRLTDAFVKGLKLFNSSNSAVIFLDAVEKMTVETELWLWNQLLTAIVRHRLSNLKFVICGRQQPDLDRGWKDAAVVRQLKPLQQEHIQIYLQKRGISEGAEQLARMLEISTKGNMMEIATYVDAYLIPDDDEDDW